MDSYKQMYFKLFNKITDVIVELQEVQEEVEEIFISKGDEKASTKIEIRKKPDLD